MCGITAIWGGQDEKLLQQVSDSLIHRGPDGSGSVSWEQGGLGHRRLAIMDPAGGQQPIFSEDDQFGIVANGEIYNFAALKADLSRGGHQFRTSSDSEVPVHLYENMHINAVKPLDGMFSLAISDGNELFLARDPVGIKPLYHGTSGGKKVFASELKALAGKAADVQEFPPGTFFHSSLGFQKYCAIPKREENMEMTEQQACTKIRSTLEGAIEKRLMSDVPLGAFLSGGLDSSIIAAAAKQRLGELHTFSVGTEGSRDLEAARTVADHIGSIHHEYLITPDIIKEHLPEILYYLESFDQDLVRSAIPCFFVSRLASEYVKVILTGEGADELFGGYTYYKDFDSSMPLHDELYRSVCSLHNINLQRVDRLTMAHSIEGRVPFLDLEMIALGQEIPTRLKLKETRDSSRIEKWILRKAFEDLLPSEIVWRGKEQFDEGSGSTDILPLLGEYFFQERQAEAYAKQHTRDRIRSIEEGMYHKLLCDSYADPDTVLSNVARWQENRIS